jgi:5-methylcytosine-specific restriction endonuclease McrA
MQEKPNLEDFFEIINSKEFQAFQEEFRHKHHNANKWNHQNPEKLKFYREQYEKSEKGIEARSKVKHNRKMRMIEAQADLDYNEKMLIRDFYNNCPEGYEVDHIVPISKGGKHCLSNLQYLTPEENRKKSSRLYYKKYDL